MEEEAVTAATESSQTDGGQSAAKEAAQLAASEAAKAKDAKLPVERKRSRNLSAVSYTHLTRRKTRKKTFKCRF